MRLPLTERETARIRGTWRDCAANRRGARQLRQLRHCALAMRNIGRNPMEIGRWVMDTKPGNAEAVLIGIGLTACAMIAIMADVEPLPLVPATTQVRSRASGLPRASSSSRVRVRFSAGSARCVGTGI